MTTISCYICDIVARLGTQECIDLFVDRRQKTFDPFDLRSYNKNCVYCNHKLQEKYAHGFYETDDNYIPEEDDISEVIPEEDNDADGEYEVERILDVDDWFDDNDDLIVRYLVKWKNFEQPTWEPEENLTHCDELRKELTDSLISRLEN